MRRASSSRHPAHPLASRAPLAGRVGGARELATRRGIAARRFWCIFPSPPRAARQAVPLDRWRPSSRSSDLRFSPRRNPLFCLGKARRQRAPLHLVLQRAYFGFMLLSTSIHPSHNVDYATILICA